MTTETLPVVVPFEPTTPIRQPRERVTEIRPSEAIRLGMLTYPNALRGIFADREQRAACAVGAMAIGYGWEPGSKDLWITQTDAHLPEQLDPPCGCRDVGSHRTAVEAIYHLNDRHEWNRESIADWLAEQGL